MSGQNNLVSIRPDPKSEPASSSPYLSVTGSLNTLSGNRLILSGESISHSGTESVLLGRDIHSRASRSIVVGEGTRVISDEVLILGKYQIDLAKWSSGQQKYVRVVEGQRDYEVPRYL